MTYARPWTIPYPRAVFSWIHLVSGIVRQERASYRRSPNSLPLASARSPCTWDGSGRVLEGGVNVENGLGENRLSEASTGRS